MTWTKLEIINLLEKASNAGVKIELTDEQIVDCLGFNEYPGSDLGFVIMKNIIKTIEQQGDKSAPVRFKIFEKQWPENKIEVYLFANEGKLCGPDILNSIYVMNGNLFSVPPTSEEFKNIREGGKKFTNFAELFGALIGAKVEAMQSEYEVVEMNKIEGFETANIKVPSFLQRFFEKNNKDFNLEADIFLKAEIKLI